MVAVLFTVTLIASAGVGAVNMITADAIAEANAAATTAAVANVLPEFDKTDISEQTIDDMTIVVYTATKGSETVGYAVESMTKNGFGGAIRLMVGFGADGKILNVNVLQQAETPGLGTKMTEEGNVLLGSIQNKNSWEVDFKVKKDGGELDALTAATISSRAYYEAVARAYEAYKVACGYQETADGVSGATAQKGGQNE
ncbi:MAG: RnfABCDGE type electron transport complex subunit G [Alistipes sp.]|nr:RnfABCDGE type electron transport complex subunit G [Alistipes sp.]MBO7343824.1 RnfABCDGE type electron transport complex subunit G [Alistipes sp.]